MDELLRRYLTTKEARALKDALDDFTDSRYILSAFEAAAEDGEVVPGMDLSLSEQDELLSRYIGRAATSSDHHSSLAADTAEILQRVVDKALNQWPYTETKHVGLLSNLSNPRIERVRSSDAALVLPSFSEIRATLRSTHVIPFVSDAADRTGLQLPLFTDMYVMDALPNPDEGRLQIADRLIQLARARQVQLRKHEEVVSSIDDVDDEGEIDEGENGENKDRNIDALLPYESITALRNYFEDRTMLNLYPLAFFKSADDIREQMEADRALEKIAAVTIAAPGDASPLSPTFSGALKDLSFPPCVQNKQAMKLAYSSLQNLNSASSPQKKMDVIADTCDLLSGMLRARISVKHDNDVVDGGNGDQPSTGKTHVDVVGADDLLPALMWLILYSARLQSSGPLSISSIGFSRQPPPPPLNLLAHCSFIERYRDPTQFSGRASYCLTHLRSCLQFLVTLGFVHGESLTKTEPNNSNLTSPPPLMVMDIDNFEEVCKKCGKGEHSKFARLCVRCGSPLDSSSISSSSIFSVEQSSSLDCAPLSRRGVVV